MFLHAVASITLQIGPSARGLQVVLLRDKVYIKCEGVTNAELHVASISDLSRWTKLTSNLPTHSCALTTYHSQLVLVGGKDTTTQRVTNKLLTSDTGHDWQPSLPPMLTLHCSPSVVNTISPEYLVVASDFEKVEILTERLWVSVEHRMWQCALRGFIFHNGRLYFDCCRAIYHCDVEELASCAQRRTDQHHSLWSEIVTPGRDNVNIASFGQQLIALGQLTNAAAYPQSLLPQHSVLDTRF